MRTLITFPKSACQGHQQAWQEWVNANEHWKGQTGPAAHAYQGALDNLDLPKSNETVFQQKNPVGYN